MLPVATVVLLSVFVELHHRKHTVALLVNTLLHHFSGFYRQSTDMGGFGGLAMGLGMILWLTILGPVVWAIRAMAWPRRVPVEESALEAVKLRYARGEISQGEFEQARRALAPGVTE
jgi:uncharacterized membrane protein